MVTHWMFIIHHAVVYLLHSSGNECIHCPPLLRLTDFTFALPRRQTLSLPTSVCCRPRSHSINSQWTTLAWNLQRQTQTTGTSVHPPTPFPQKSLPLNQPTIAAIDPHAPNCNRKQNDHPKPAIPQSRLATESQAAPIDCTEKILKEKVSCKRFWFVFCILLSAKSHEFLEFSRNTANNWPSPIPTQTNCKHFSWFVCFNSTHGFQTPNIEDFLAAKVLTNSTWKSSALRRILKTMHQLLHNCNCIIPLFYSIQVFCLICQIISD